MWNDFSRKYKWKLGRWLCMRSDISCKQAIVKVKKHLLQVLFMIFVSFLYLKAWKETPSRSPKPFFVHRPNDSPWFVIDTEGCRIPWLDTMDPRIRRFIKDERVVCDKDFKPLVESTLKLLYVVTSRLSSYGIKNISELECCFQPFKRVDGFELSKFKHGHEVDMEVMWEKECRSFNRTWESGEGGLVAEPSEEFVKVSCRREGAEVYRDFFAFVRERAGEPNGAEAGRASVLVVGLDSVSRLNFHRQMPKTAGLIEANLSSVEFLGYNKVGLNTFPNLVPALSGASAEELLASCWLKDKPYFDGCPFLWDDFKRAGFTTAFGEDSSIMGLFSYLKVGFRSPPTDFYLRAFNQIAESEIGKDRGANFRLCLGSRLNCDVLLDTVVKYGLTMLETLSFGVFLETSLTHDYLNLPRLADDSFARLIETFLEAGLFERSVVVLLSDHGMRFGGIQSTYQGYLEDRLPFLFVIYPRWFSDAYPSAVRNLHRNALRLTTPFDLHETLKDLINTVGLTRTVVKERSRRLQYLPKLPRGISLFLPVPGHRTCEDAGIPAPYCTCGRSCPIQVDSPEAHRCALRLLGHLNSLLEDFKQCSELSLSKILAARRETPTAINEDKRDSWFVFYVVTIETIPGFGHFQATVVHHQFTYEVTGTVSRINNYGNQSFCMPDVKLKLYCFCKTI